MDKAAVQRLINTAPPSWKTMFQRYNLGSRPTVDQLIETVLEYTPSMRGSGGRGEAQYAPPKRVREEAWKGLVLSHRENYTSQSGIGLVRAMQLVVRPKIWNRSINRMHKYFDRHQRDQNAKNFGNDANPSRGWMAWLNWGGDSGKAWADRLVGSARVNPLQSIPTEKRIKSILRNHIVSLNKNQLKRIEAIYIIGSTAQGNDRPTSDIDIAVIMTPPKRGTLRSSDFTKRFHHKYQSDLYKPKYEGRALDFQFFWTTDPEWKSYSKVRLENPRVSKRPLTNSPKQIKTKLVEPEQIEFMGFDERKIAAIRPHIPLALSTARRRLRTRRRFPTPIVAMEPNEILYGRSVIDNGHPRGAGHGMYFTNYQLIKINPYMEPIDLLANVIHENLHHLDPDLPEEVVAITTAEIMEECFGIYTLGRPMADGRLVLHFNPSDLKGRHIPEKYLKGLSASERQDRIRELTVARDRYDRLRGRADSKADLDIIFTELPSDKVARKKGLVKQSAYSKVAFDRGIEINRTDFDDTARRALRYYTGSAKAADVKRVSAALQKSFSKGIGAWASGGHRPGATKFNWGDARVHSLLVGGKTYWSTDKKQAAAFPPAMRKAIESKLSNLYEALRQQNRERDVEYIKSAKRKSR